MTVGPWYKLIQLKYRCTKWTLKYLIIIISIKDFFFETIKKACSFHNLKQHSYVHTVHYHPSLLLVITGLFKVWLSILFNLPPKFLNYKTKNRQGTGQHQVKTLYRSAAVTQLIKSSVVFSQKWITRTSRRCSQTRALILQMNQAWCYNQRTLNAMTFASTESNWGPLKDGTGPCVNLPSNDVKQWAGWECYGKER